MNLTPRQTELITLLAHGYTSHELREKMGISTDTMYAHVASIKKRLNAKTREEAVALAVGSGLIFLQKVGQDEKEIPP